jgi:methionyl-tRNA formyltransferase
MRVVILTSFPRGLPARCLQRLLQSEAVTVAGVVVAEASARPGRRMLLRKAGKVLRIGPLGALNGLRLRRWYRDDDTEDVAELARRHGLPVTTVPFVNSDATRHAFRHANSDLGISLGNGYIAESIFSLPRHGMINVHGEMLPEFRGAQSVIWPIHEGLEETGFCIHQIDRHIDTGAILWQQRYPISFASTLRDTVERTSRVVRAEIPAALQYVCENYGALRQQAHPQGPGRSWTTPSLREFVRMTKNNRSFYERRQTTRLT